VGGNLGMDKDSNMLGGKSILSTLGKKALGGMLTGPISPKHLHGFCQESR